MYLYRLLTYGGNIYRTIGVVNTNEMKAKEQIRKFIKAGKLTYINPHNILLHYTRWL